MGCDIHWTIEQRPKNDPAAPWLGFYSTSLTPRMRPSAAVGDTKTKGWHFAPALKDRNYQFFAALAGVRGLGPEPNGMPDDASGLTKYAVACWSDDGHSHGHCTLDTFVERWFSTASDDFRAWVVQQRLDKPYFTLTEHLFDYIEPDRYEYRVVFWFDN